MGSAVFYHVNFLQYNSRRTNIFLKMGIPRGANGSPETKNPNPGRFFCNLGIHDFSAWDFRSLFFRLRFSAYDFSARIVTFLQNLISQCSYENARSPSSTAVSVPWSGKSDSGPDRLSAFSPDLLSQQKLRHSSDDCRHPSNR